MSHIDDDSLELYALNRVSQVEVVAIEEHLLVCPYCSDRLQSLKEFALAAQIALRMMDTELVGSHRTHDGLIHLYVRRIGMAAWVGTIRGESIGGGVAAKSREEAVELCQASFKEMFPEHVCGRGCTTKPDVAS